MSEVNMVKAKETYDTLCKMLDNRDWQYEKFEEDLMIKSGLNGDDFPIEFVMRVIPECEIVSLMSWLPFKISEEKRVDMALAVCAVNDGLVVGSFDYNIERGETVFRFTTCYKDSVLSEDLLEEMIMISATIVDKYNDQFFMISKNMMTLQQFLESKKNS